MRALIPLKLTYRLLPVLFTASLTACDFVESGGRQGNDPPSVVVGDITVTEGEVGTLDGSETTDDFGDLRSVTWELAESTIPGLVLDLTVQSEDPPVATFTAPTVDDRELLTFKLTVVDRDGTSVSENVTATINNTPSANAGDDRLITEQMLATLDGASSSDTDGTISTYEWVQESGIPVTLAVDPNNPNIVTFTVPTIGVGTNQLPTASAGPDQIIDLPGTATLNGTVSDDGLPTPPGALTTSWTLVSGPGVPAFGDAGAVDTTADLPAAGTYVLRLTADDGQLSVSDDLTITPTLVEVMVTASSDDAEEQSDGFMRLGNGDLELGFDGNNQQTVGVRFNDVAIPQGATIVDAWVQFTADETDSDGTALTIHGEAIDDAPTFSNTDDDITDRTLTAASVAWNPPPWDTVGQAGPAERTPNLAAIVQEIVNRPGWTAGNSLALIFAGTGERTAESFNGGAALAPMLHVDIAGQTTLSAPSGMKTFGPTGVMREELRFSLQVTDNDGATSTDTITITINDGPTASDVTGVGTNEDEAVTVDVIGNDQDLDGTLDPATVVIRSLPANGNAVVMGNGEVVYTPNLNFEGPTDSFTYTVNDNDGAISNLASVNLDIAPVNDPPVAAGDTGTFVEDTAGNPLDVLANDVDVDSVDTQEITLVGPTSAGGTVNISGPGPGNTLSYTPLPNFFGNETFSYTMEDAAGEMSSALVSITVTNVNDAPSLIALSSTQVAENQAIGTVVGTFTTTDFDPGDVHTYALVGGGGSSGNSQFTILGNQLRTAAVFDADAQSSYSIRVRSTDNGTPALSLDQIFTITITNVNEPPTDIALSNNSVAENLSSNTFVGNFSTTDPDAGDTHTYNLVSGAGSSGNSAFLISGAQLRTAQTFNFEGQSSYSIRVRSTDGGGQSFEEQFTINIVDVNEAPTLISLSNNSVAENQPINTVVGTFSTSDPDPGDSHSYALVGGAGSSGNGSFNISGAQLRTSQVFDFETQTSYSIRVRSTDNGSPAQSRDQIFTININNLLDPTGSGGGGELLSSNASPEPLEGCWATSVHRPVSGVLQATDPETPGQLSFALVQDGSKGLVTIVDPASGTFLYTPLDGSVRGSDTFTFLVSDPDGGVALGAGRVIIEPRIMALGDSVTEGIIDGAAQTPVPEQRTGYRSSLLSSLNAAGYSVDFVGTLSTGAGVAGFDPDNEGRPGWSADEIASGSATQDPQFPDSGVYSWLTANPADFVLLHVGTDVLDSDASGVVAILDEIDRWEGDTGEEVTVLVARIIDRNPADPAVTAFNDAVSAAVDSRINDPGHPAYPDRIILVDQQAALAGDDALPDPAYYGDSAHPNASGYANMAAAWLQAIQQYCGAPAATNQ